MCRDIKQMHQDAAREGSRVSAGAWGCCSRDLGMNGWGATSPCASCARGGWKANKHPSVGGQTPAFCSSARCNKPLPSLSFPA